MTDEKRRYPRVECKGIAGVEIIPGGSRCAAILVNLSAGGCLLVLKEPQCISLGTIVELTFTINKLLFRTQAHSKAMRSDNEIGFEFELLSDNLQRQIEALLERLIEDLPAEGALRSPGEQRRHRRLECAGPATVQTAPCEELCPATIANLSAGGCLMVLRRPKRLSNDMLVELTFNVNHLPFRVRGLVKAIRSDKAIGFQFHLLSERVRRQLDDLMMEIMENIMKRQAERKRMSLGEGGRTIKGQSPCTPLSISDGAGSVTIKKSHFSHSNDEHLHQGNLK